MRDVQRPWRCQFAFTTPSFWHSVDATGFDSKVSCKKSLKSNISVKAMLMTIPCRLQVARLLVLHRLMLKRLTASFLFTRTYNMRCSSAEINWLNLAANFDA